MCVKSSQAAGAVICQRDMRVRCASSKQVCLQHESLQTLMALRLHHCHDSNYASKVKRALQQHVLWSFKIHSECLYRVQKGI